MICSFQKYLHRGIRITLFALVKGVKEKNPAYSKINYSLVEQASNALSRLDWWTTIMEYKNLSDTNLSSVNIQRQFMLAASTRSLYKIGLFIGSYIYPVITPIGLIGNVLTLLVLVQNRGSGLSYRIYMALLAVFDSITLLNGITGEEGVCDRMVNWDK